MGKKSRQIGKGNKLIVDSNKTEISQEKKEKIQARIAELSDEQLERLLERGKITQYEYEAILEYRKKIKKKKTEKEKFEERIRCNNGIIKKIVNLGKKFRKQENEYKQYQENLKDEEKILNKDERIRSSSGRKQKERTHDR